MDPDAIHLINTLLDIDIPVDDQKKENNMCQAVEEWKQELRDEGEKIGYANGEKAGYANGEKAGYANGEKAILKTLIQNSGLSLSEIAQMTQQPLALLQTLAVQ
jgi:flagellar biosynthesis/type III secretory pathway protein FliH